MRLMAPPNATWQQILIQARANPEVLKQPEVGVNPCWVWTSYDTLKNPQYVLYSLVLSSPLFPSTT